jgi:ABC-type multidrug transport system ATPase subunit
MHEAEVLCDRLAIMNQGQIIAEGTPTSLRDQFTPGYVAVFEKISSQGQRIQDTANHLKYQVIEDSSGIYVRAPNLQTLLQFQEDVNQSALQLRPAHLEDVFLKLTGQELTADA